MDCLFWPFWVLGREERGGIPGGLGAQRKKGGAPGRTAASLSLPPSVCRGEKHVLPLQPNSIPPLFFSLILFGFVGFSKLPFLLRSLPLWFFFCLFVCLCVVLLFFFLAPSAIFLPFPPLLSWRTVRKCLYSLVTGRRRKRWGRFFSLSLLSPAGLVPLSPTQI